MLRSYKKIEVGEIYVKNEYIGHYQSKNPFVVYYKTKEKERARREGVKISKVPRDGTERTVKNK
jgi:hypothetical protein